MPDAPPDPSAAAARKTRALLVLDVVESVRLMEVDEDGFVRRWQDLVRETRQRLLPLHGARMVKSLGDGLMIECDQPRDALRLAFAVQALGQAGQTCMPPEQRMRLRVGVHWAEFVSDELDIYGSDVNLTARIASLAGPGDVVVSADMRDRIVPGLDADVEDLGDCHLKHVREPIRAYRVTPVGSAPVMREPEAFVQSDLRPALAVIPFEARSLEPDHLVIGELIADGVIAQLSRSADLRVISRLSTTALRGRAATADSVQHHLHARFALAGSYVASGDRLLVTAELTDTRKGEVIWAERLQGSVGDLLQVHSELVTRLSEAAAREIVRTQVEQSLVQPMPRLDSSALLLGGIAMMHRASVREFDRSRQALEALVERHGRIAAPRAWLAKWHVLRIVRGMSEDPQREARRALELTRRALDSEPQNALTLSVEGLIHTQVLGDFDRARMQLDAALRASPNESMAWLFRSVLSTMNGDASGSVAEALYATALSPIDPLKYFFELITAAALLADHQHEAAIEHCRRSIRANRHHAPTYRTLLTAQYELGRIDEARAALDSLLAEQPDLTVAAYLAMGSASSATRQRCAQALRALGLPED